MVPQVLTTGRTAHWSSTKLSAQGRHSTLRVRSGEDSRLSAPHPQPREGPRRPLERDPVVRPGSGCPPLPSRPASPPHPPSPLLEQEACGRRRPEPYIDEAIPADEFSSAVIPRLPSVRHRFRSAGTTAGSTRSRPQGRTGRLRMRTPDRRPVWVDRWARPWEQTASTRRARTGTPARNRRDSEPFSARGSTETAIPESGSRSASRLRS